MSGVNPFRRRLLPFRNHALLLATLVVVAVVAGVAEAGEPRPYRVAVQVVYGTPDGPTILREEIELGLARTLASSGCFEEVEPHTGEGSPDADLLLKVQLDQTFEGISRFNIKIADAYSFFGIARSSRQLGDAVESWFSEGAD